MGSPTPIARQRATFNIAEPTEHQSSASPKSPHNSTPPKTQAPIRRISGSLDLFSTVKGTNVVANKVATIANGIEDRIEEEKKSLSRNHSPTQPGPLLRRESPTGNVTRRWTPPDPSATAPAASQRGEALRRHASPDGPIATSPFIQIQNVPVPPFNLNNRSPVPPLDLKGKGRKQERTKGSPTNFRNVPLVRSTSASAVANAVITQTSPKGEIPGRIRSEEKKPAIEPQKEKERITSPGHMGRSVSFMPERRSRNVTASHPGEEGIGPGILHSPTSLERSISRTKSQRHLLPTKSEAGIFDAPFINKKWHALLQTLKEKPLSMDLQYFEGLINKEALRIVDQALEAKEDSQILGFSAKLNRILRSSEAINDHLFLKHIREKITEAHRLFIEFSQNHKMTKELTEYKDLIEGLVAANNLKDLLLVLRTFPKTAEALFQLMSGNDKLEILKVLEKWEPSEVIRTQIESIAGFHLKEINSLLTRLEIKEYVFKEFVEKYETRNIYRQDICRSLAPSEGNITALRLKGHCNHHDYDEILDAGNLKNRPDFREIYFSHLFYTLNMLGFNPTITDEELDMQVTKFLKDYQSIVPTDAIHYVPFETILQLSSMKGWGICDNLFRSLFPLLSHLAHKPIPNGKKVFMIKPVTNISNPETVIEVASRDKFSVLRSVVYSVHSVVKDSYGTLRAEDKLAELTTEWRAGVDFSINLDLPIRTLKIRNFKFTDQATLADRQEIIRILMESDVVQSPRS